MMNGAIRWTLLILLIVAAALRIGGMLRREVDRDERFTAERTRYESVGELMNSLGRSGRKQTAYYLLINRLTRVLPQGIRTARAVSVTAGVLSVLAIFVLARALFDPATGLLAAALLTVSRFHLYYSSIARVYSLLVLLAICSTYALFRLVENEERRRRYTACYILLASALMYLHYFGIILVALQIGSMLVCAPWRRTGRLGILCAVLLAALYTPLLSSLLADSSDDYGMRYIARPSHPKEILIASAIYLQSFVPATVGGGAFVLVLCGLGLRERRARLRMTVLALIAWAFLPIVFTYGFSVTFRSVWRARYMIVSLPPLIILIAFAARRLARPDRAHILALLFVLWHCLSLAGEPRSPFVPHVVHEHAFRAR